MQENLTIIFDIVSMGSDVLDLNKTNIPSELLERKLVFGSEFFCYDFPTSPSLNSKQERVRCNFFNKKLPLENELEICRYFIELQETNWHSY